MLLSLVDSLRCPRHDDEAPLVLAVESWSGSRIAEGTLGCPVCHARYAIHRGAVDFAPGAVSVRWEDVAVDPLRLAAQLSLTDSGGVILLTGRYSSVAEQLAQFGETTFVLADAESSSPLAVTIRVDDRLPFTDGTLRAAAVDGTRATESFLAEVVRCLRGLGRLVVPASASLPGQIRIIAEDEHEKVGEASPVIRPVLLRRAPPNSDL